MLLEVVEDDGVGLPLLVILMCILFQFVGVGPLLVEGGTTQFERAVLYLYFSMFARNEGETNAGRSDGTVREYGGQVAYQRLVYMCLERGALVLDCNSAYLVAF